MPLFGQNNTSVLVSAKTIEGIGGVSYGIGFALVNIETDDIYYSDELSKLKQSYSIIERLPPGKYRVGLFSNSAIITDLDNPIHKFFGILELEADKCYYLGNFVGKREKGKESPLIYIVEKDEESLELVKYLRKRKVIENAESLVNTYPYASDSLKIDVMYQR